jgi:phosphoribosyl-ATP pyrophosphohydrolase
MSGNIKILDDLWEVIEERSSSENKDSYSKIMLEKDENTLARKMGEEAIETIVAALGQSKSDVINESADLLFHWLLLLKKLDISPSDVYEELEKRRKSS